METHPCKFCGRSFPSGRSLGGHMRSHLVSSSYLDYDEKSARGYGLRENPRKSWRFKEPGIEKHCIEFEVEGKEEGDSWSFGVQEDEQEELGIQKDEKLPIKKSRKVETISDSSSPSPSSPEYGALCLMLLSRGASSVSESSEVLKRSESDDFKFGLKKVEFFPSESNKGIKFTVLESGKSNKSSKNNIDSETENFLKRNRYECTICNKSFHSYQALGGHCASHKKNRAEASSSVSPAPKELISGKFRVHQCPICGKVFASGQALGGHKRSHLVSDNASSSASAPEMIETENKNLKKNSIDLNLPAPDFGVSDSFDSNGTSDETKFTSFGKSCKFSAFMI